MLTVERARELLRYDPETGEMWWRVQTRNHRTHKPVGTVHRRSGAIQVCIEGRIYLVHRVAFLIVEGRWPHPEVDHWDNDPSNNRWKNLREATRRQNAGNTRGFSKTGEGLKGASPHPTGKWQAQLKIDGKQTPLGLFDTELAAHEAYCVAARVQFGEFFNAGRNVPLRAEDFI